MPTNDPLHNSYQTYLMVSENGTSWEKLIDIKDFPDLGTAPPTLDATTLSDSMHIYINDIKDTGGALESTANYTLEGYTALEAYNNVTKHYAIWFGATTAEGVDTPSGQYGKFKFQGELSHWKKGAGVSAVQEMGISIAPSTIITRA